MSINHIYQNAEGGALAKTITGTVSVNGGISNVPYTTIPSDIELLKCSAISPQYSTFIWVLDFIDPSGNGFFDLSSGRLPALLRRDGNITFKAGSGAVTTICSFSYQTQIY